MQTTHKKLIDAGFTVLRRGDAREPIIKQALPCGSLGNISWKTMEKFPTKAARDRRWKELEADPKVILDDFFTDRPYWDEERGGVAIPLLGIVLDAKNLAKEDWSSARTLCAAAGQRMFTKSEAYILMWQKDEINAILKEHNGDLLDGWFWTDTEDEDPEHSATYAWYVYFGSGYFVSYYNYYTCIVRAVAAL